MPGRIALSSGTMCRSSGVRIVIARTPGGTVCARCADGKACAGNGDCASLACRMGACVASGCADGVSYLRGDVRAEVTGPPH